MRYLFDVAFYSEYSEKCFEYTDIFIMIQHKHLLAEKVRLKRRTKLIDLDNFFSKVLRSHLKKETCSHGSFLKIPALLLLNTTVAHKTRECLSRSDFTIMSFSNV